MLSKRGSEYLPGGLFIGLVATIVGANVVFAISSSPPRGTFTEDALRGLVDIAGDRDLFILSTAFDLAANLITVPVAAMLYIVFRSHSRTLALLGSFGLLAAAVLYLTGNMVSIALLSFAQDLGEIGTQAESVLASARAFGLMSDASFAMGSTGVALGVFSYGLLVLTTNALPRWIGVVGILGGIVAPFVWLLYIEVDLVAIGLIGLQIGLLFALIWGVWLVVKGAREAVR